jgi:hypothetical protein
MSSIAEAQVSVEQALACAAQYKTASVLRTRGTIDKPVASRQMVVDFLTGDWNGSEKG